ncbi:hypothetical protein CsSME_00037647 [Camellia sinensis var. sinensis]
MAKTMPRIGSCRNGRIGSRKNTRRIPKRVIHVQASSNNTIVTIIDVRGWVVSWSCASACGFRGTKGGTCFEAYLFLHILASMKFLSLMQLIKIVVLDDAYGESLFSLSTNNQGINDWTKPRINPLCLKL